MSNVVSLPVITRLNVDPERIIAAAAGKLEHVIIIGYTHDGEEYFASSQADGSAVLWSMERAKHKLMKIVDEMADE